MVRDCDVHVAYCLNFIKDFVTWYVVQFVNIFCVPKASLCSLTCPMFDKVYYIVLMYYMFINSSL